MTKSKFLRRTFLAVFSMVFCLVPASGQEFSEDGTKFWKQYQSAKALNDVKEAVRQIRRNKPAATEVFETLILYFCSSDHQGFAEDTKMLAEDMESVLKTKQYTYRFYFVLNLIREKRGQWLTAWNGDIDGFTVYLEGKKSNNVYKLDEAMEALKKSLKLYEELGDDDMIAKVTMHLAMTREGLEEHYEACVDFKKSLDRMQTLPFPHPDLKYVESGYNRYIAKGYDPTKPKDEGGEPGPEEERGTGTEGEEIGTDGEAFKKAEFVTGEAVESAAMKYTSMKNPDDFITPAYNTGYNPYLWPSSWFDSRSEATVQFKPYFGYGVSFYGTQVNILRANNKFYFDIDSQEKTRVEIKPITKAYKLNLTGLEKGPDGKALKYQMFVQATSQQEVMFGIEMNNAPETMEAISLRVRTGCYTKGKILGETCVLIDDNSDGVFGDYYYVESDFITKGDFRHWRPDAILVGREKVARPFSRYMRFGDKLYYMTVDKFGRKLNATEVACETGTLRFVYKGATQPTSLILRLIDEDNPGTFFNVAGFKEPVVLPIGEYEIACGKIETKKKKQAKQIRIYHGKAEYIKIWQDKETVLELGEPFVFTFDTTYVGKKFIVEGKSVNVWGKSGELYTQFFDSVPQPILSIRDRDSGKVLVKGEKMRLAQRDDFYAERYCQWHPLDFEFEFKKGATLEVRLEAKNVKLLGGPIKGDWQ